MRKISLVLVAAMLCTAGNVVANHTNPKDPGKLLSTQIGKLLQDNFFIVENTDLTAKIRFTINEENEIVVLSVNTENEVLEAFVKSRLNYQKVRLQGIKEGRMYTVPIRITA
ncbi:MAG TPA: hypothetical protein VKN36_10550 [Eudoraea sp.]|nr:hypothetical protein [Eudoraea sp.]